MSDRRPVKILATKDGWKCPNPPCIGRPRNPLGSMLCVHCGCRFGARFVVIGPPETSDSPETSASTEKWETAENVDTPEDEHTPEKANTPEKDDDKGKEKEKAD
ncbi:hypothetical protein NW768_002881 [Fusarium equiseti]|uniref:Uncharacterized protein n=1 Tax=Fusarium equiseti TaxID=61235 RepID=A0ABQ8RKB0_FUSEQ|nr:hypothetical protein NW768_002881 [Fusarium equiseti]